MGQDGTSPLAIRALERMGVEKVFDPEKVALVMDHSSPSPIEGVSALHTMMREFGKKTGATVYDVGEGVCHQLIPEKGRVVAGDLMVGCDSHTCTYGAINVFSTGVGSTDGAAAMASGKLWFKVPETLRVNYNGALQPGVFSKDLILYLAGQIGADGATYEAIEFHGPVIDALTVEARMTMSNMAIEVGAKAGLMNADNKTIEWFNGRGEKVPAPQNADADAVYKTTLEFDTNAIGPNVLHRYWTLTSAGITQVNLTFSYLAGDVIGNEANYVLSAYNGAWAVVGGSVNTVSHSATISNVTTFGNWTLGESPSFLGLSVSDIIVSEGNNGTASADFVVNLSGTSSQTVTVGYATHDSTALVADNDYVAGSDVLTISPGETSGIVSVLLNGDTKREPNELLALILSAPTNAALLNSLAVCTIENDDSLSRVSIADFAGAEGTSGDSTHFNFIVSLSNPSNDSISFHFHTENKTAKADTDYQKVTDGFITINPGDTAALITVIVNGDTLAEPDDTFFVKLSGAVNATLDDSAAAGIILNDDGATLTIGDVVDFEGNSTATPKHFNFKLQLSNPLPQQVTVNYSTDSSEGSATGGVDFNRKNTTATIPPGQTTGFITIDVKGDTVDELDETFNVFIWNSINATIIHNTGTGTILNDDVNITVTDTAKAEGQSGITNFTLKVKLSKSSTHPVSVHYMTADSNTVADNDYADTAGIMTFSPGTSSKDLVIRVYGDVLPENHEKFFVRLDNVTNAIIADSQGVGTIINDDAKFTINDVSVAEGDSGEVKAIFTVSLTSPCPTTVKVTTVSADSVATRAHGW